MGQIIPITTQGPVAFAGQFSTTVVVVGDYAYTLPASSGTFATEAYVTTALGSYLPLTGGTMTGPLQLATYTTGTLPSEVDGSLIYVSDARAVAAGIGGSWAYLATINDVASFLPLSGGALTGPITFGGSPYALISWGGASLDIGFDGDAEMYSDGSGNVTINSISLAVTGALRVAGALADGTYSCGSGSITITNGVISAIS